jgi:alkylated DNA repair dioxygenase AlkB
MTHLSAKAPSNQKDKMDLFSDYKNPVLPFIIPNDIESSCRWDDDLKVFFLTIPNGELVFSESFFDKKISDRSVAYFQENDSLNWQNTDWQTVTDQELEKIKFTHIDWKHDTIKMYGKTIPLPRLTSWYGDQGRSYTYSGITSHPSSWNKGLLYIKEEIEKISQMPFNSVLLNWYRNGEDHLNWHTDDEKELGSNPIIASVNFGETRDFVIRRNDDPSKKITIPLGHGTLLVMRGELQHFWQHSVPKRKKVKGSRFNLTFRKIF